MLEQYKVEKTPIQREKSKEEQENQNIEVFLFKLVSLVVEKSYYFDRNNKMVMLKDKEKIIEEINRRASIFCKDYEIDFEKAMQKLKKVILLDNELKYNLHERNLLIDLLNIDEGLGERD